MFSFYYKKSKNKTITLDALLHLLKNKYPTLDLNKSHIYRIIRDNNITLKMTRIRHEPIKHFGKDIDINTRINWLWTCLGAFESHLNIFSPRYESRRATLSIYPIEVKPLKKY